MELLEIVPELLFFAWTKNAKFNAAEPLRVGMSELLDESTLEHIVTMGRSGTSDNDVAAAPIELNTMVFAEPGKTIKGDDIYNLIQAAKAENVTITSKLRQLKDVSIQTIVSPGPGVVEQAVRSGKPAWAVTKESSGSSILSSVVRGGSQRSARLFNGLMAIFTSLAMF